MATSSRSVTRAMQQLQRALADVGERASSDRTIRSRAEALLEVAADLPVALLIANNSGRFVDVNARATKLTGHSRAELLRMSVWDLTPTPNAARGRRLWKQFLERGELAGIYALCHKTGRQIHADFRAWANVLPGVHVSALATPALVRGAKPTVRRRARR